MVECGVGTGEGGRGRVGYSTMDRNYRLYRYSRVFAAFACAFN